MGTSLMEELKLSMEEPMRFSLLPTHSCSRSGLGEDFGKAGPQSWAGLSGILGIHVHRSFSGFLSTMTLPFTRSPWFTSGGCGLTACFPWCLSRDLCSQDERCGSDLLAIAASCFLCLGGSVLYFTGGSRRTLTWSPGGLTCLVRDGVSPCFPRLGDRDWERSELLPFCRDDFPVLPP